MFRRVYRITTELRQRVDDTIVDEGIEAKIKKCQRENDRCTA